jgi:hypothetical protein
MVVLACIVGGAGIHVFPPSLLNSHSYAARRPADAVTRSAVPDSVPVLAAKTRAWCVGVLRRLTPALSTIDVAFSTFASAWV